MSIPEPFAEGSSLLHRLDPRGKLVVAAGFSLLLALSSTCATALTGLAIAVVALALARLHLKRVLARLLVVNSFIIFLWVILPFTYTGDPLWRFGPLTATRQGLAVTGLITLKSNAIVLALIALLATSPVITLGQAMQQLRIPDKLCHLLLFTYRYLHVLEQEYHRLIQAMKVRGFEPRTNLHTYRSYAYLVAMLLVRSFDRAERVFQAMLCRGFQGKFYSLRTFTFEGRDRWFVALSFGVILLLLILECLPRFWPTRSPCRSL